MELSKRRPPNVPLLPTLNGQFSILISLRFLILRDTLLLLKLFPPLIPGFYSLINPTPDFWLFFLRFLCWHPFLCPPLKQMCARLHHPLLLPPSIVPHSAHFSCWIASTAMILTHINILMIVKSNLNVCHKYQPHMSNSIMGVFICQNHLNMAKVSSMCRAPSTHSAPLCKIHTSTSFFILQNPL